MDTLVIAGFLLIILALFATPLQAGLRRWFQPYRKRIFLVPAVLTGVFIFWMWRHGALSPPFLLVVAAYAFLPALFARIRGPGSGPVVILILWLPLEFSLGRYFVPEPIQGTAHSVAYGVAITLALFLFLVYRDTPGMKYRLPREGSDFLIPLLGLLAVAPVLIFLGLQLSFINPFHVSPHLTFVGFAKRFLTIFLGVALPEEILFRSLIQNLLMQRFGSTNRTLIVAAAIFGAAHLNNGPGALPNWRYMILATIAGFAYGKVFQRTNTVLSSTAVHASVNTLRHFFF